MRAILLGEGVELEAEKSLTEVEHEVGGDQHLETDTT
jgi:hypothetical protein